MWVLVAGALAAEVTLSAGVQDGSTPRAGMDGARASVGIRLAEALAVTLEGGGAFDPVVTYEYGSGPYRLSVWSVAPLLDVGFGAPEGGAWAGGPHLLVGPTLHGRRAVDGLEMPPFMRHPVQETPGLALGGAFDAWRGRVGARLSVVDHLLLEDLAWDDDSAAGLRSTVVFGLDLRARL